MTCTGIDAQVGFFDESTYGTVGTPDRFLYFETEGIAHSIERIEAPSLGRGANTALHADDWEAGIVQSAGPLALMVRNKGFGLIFEHMMGANSITTPGGATLTRDQTFTMATLQGKSLSVQVGRPDTNGTVNPFTYVGSKIVTWELKNSVSGFLELLLTLDARNEDRSTALATASYATTPKLFAFTGGAITLGGTTAAIKNCTVTGSPGLDIADFNIGSDLKTEPCQTENWDIGGSIDGNFVGMEDYNRFINGTTDAAVVLTWTGALIELGHSYTVTITLPSVRWDGDTPNVGGPDRLQQTLPFKVLGSGATIVYRTSDVAA